MGPDPKPVFDALFSDYDFAAHNPVSQAMQKVVAVLEPKNIQKEAQALEGFYDSVKKRAAGIDNAEGKQKIIVELYDKFFKTAFPKLTEKLGIVYTPVEVVDFIIHSVNDILKQEFGQTLGSKGVHIIDPFTGTGTFITRLLQSGLIGAEELEHKFKNEIHANEIVLLAYYIAAINIEATYHSLSGTAYTPFEGICLTDTFAMYETDDMVAALMADNSERRNKQKALDIRVIIGNPPYSVGQKSGNDNAANIVYKDLDEKIRSTYAEHSKVTSVRNLYDSYIRAIRWASDRLGDNGGVIGFIAGSGWMEKAYADGMRKTLEEECSSIYIINLRGDVRKNMLSKGLAKEGENIFGQGSMTGTAIFFLVKNPLKVAKANIYYTSVGDDLKRGQKLSLLQRWRSVSSILDTSQFAIVSGDEHNDWINQRSASFEKFIPLGSKDKEQQRRLFDSYTLGVATGRDVWCYNYSKKTVQQNVERLFLNYNEQLRSYAEVKDRVDVNNFIDFDAKKTSWNRNFISEFGRFKYKNITDVSFLNVNYRPFTKSWLAYGKEVNAMLYSTRKVFGDGSRDNLAILVSGIGARNGVNLFMVDKMLDLNGLEAGAQHFPLKLYEEIEAHNSDLFSSDSSTVGYRVKDGITDGGLKHFKDAYGNVSITKEDIFYYVYGLLHSEDYRTRFADNLSKELPRIPPVKKEADFWAFVEAGRKLGDLHVNYESAELYPVTIAEGDLRLAHIADPVSYFRVEQMRYGGKRGSDKTVLHYNDKITLTNIPLEAYDYVVNGKPALDWVVERQRVKIDKDSGIVNDANDYAVETVGNPAYPLELFQRVITVSLETMRIVRGLPALEID